MKRTWIADLAADMDGKEVLLQGWIHELRDLSKVKFVLLRDRTGMTQCVALSDNKEVFAALPKLLAESVISVYGKVKKNKQARQGYEVVINKIDVLSKAAPLPISVVEKGISTDLSKRLDYRFLDTRKERVNAIFRVRSKITKYFLDFFDKQGFVNINTAKLTMMGAESGAEVFTCDYFGKPIYLAQSPQVYKQMFVCGGFERVCEIGPLFRAERSHTNRHLTEFTGADFEMGFIADENDVMDMIEQMVKHIVTGVNKECKGELSLLKVTPQVPDKIPRIQLAELREVLKKQGKEIPQDDGPDAEAEKMISEYVKKKYNSDFVFITRYPWKKTPFYHMKTEDDPSLTRSYDLVWNGLEVGTGSQREHRLDVLTQQAKEKGLDLEKDMKPYADIFRYGAPPHGGVGFGLDRMTQCLLKLDNIREAILLTRDPERVTP